MYYSLLSTVAQITALVALVRAPFEDYNILFWYIPNYIAGTLVVLNNINDENHTTSYSVLAFLSFVGNFTTACLYSQEPWCGAAPVASTLCLTAALDFYRAK
tara:strand:+ start:1508 stop:1813 length:306 start_codon:yes stop_codon:yes gene_type:complete